MDAATIIALGAGATGGALVGLRMRRTLIGFTIVGAVITVGFLSAVMWEKGVLATLAFMFLYGMGFAWYAAGTALMSYLAVVLARRCFTLRPPRLPGARRLVFTKYAGLICGGIYLLSMALLLVAAHDADLGLVLRRAPINLPILHILILTPLYALGVLDGPEWLQASSLVALGAVVYSTAGAFVGFVIDSVRSSGTRKAEPSASANGAPRRR